MADYTAVINGYDVTNTHTPVKPDPDDPEKIQISGAKTWDDGDNADGIRPAGITIRLLARRGRQKDIFLSPSYCCAG